MLKYFIVACLMLGLVAPAEAHNRRHRHPRGHRTVVITPWITFWQRPQSPRVPINRDCVYKPWNNKTICRY